MDIDRTPHENVTLCAHSLSVLEHWSCEFRQRWRGSRKNLRSVLESSRRSSRSGSPCAAGIKGKFAGKHRSRYYRQYVHSAARVESERNRGVNERGVAFLHSRGNARTWHRHERILSCARRRYTSLYMTRARTHTRTRDSFIYALVVTPASPLRDDYAELFYIPASSSPRTPPTACLLRFVILACTRAYSRVLIILVSYLYVYRVSACHKERWRARDNESLPVSESAVGELYFERSLSRTRGTIF